MPKFTYLSCDQKGQQVTAVAEAASRQDLVIQLKARGLTVLRVRETDGTQEKVTAEKNSVFRAFRSWFTKVTAPRRVSLSDLSVFWRQFATMVASGLSVIQALESIGEELEASPLKRVLNRVVSDMWEGLTLSQGFMKHKRVFSPMIVALIAAAEESGSLPTVAEEIARFLENRDRITRKVWAALTYPIFLMAFFLIVVVVATFWVVPLFRDIYSGFGAKLPWATVAVFALNEACLKLMPLIIAAVVVAVTAFSFWVRTPRGKSATDRVLLRIPVFGNLLKRAAIARFSRSFAILIKGGIPVNRALEMVADTAGNTVVADAVRTAREEILKGGKIAASLRPFPIFPRMAIRMIAAGEETGSLGDLLEKTSDFYESRVDATVSAINALIEPIIIVLIGCFVLVFVLTLYLPIFSLAGTMKG